MKTAGIIAEYNPFHNGHRYHIEETRKKTGADYVVAAISGDFVQRGAPALLDKYTRTEMALRGGADLVLELPVTTALSSAESFAMGGVCLFERLGVVTDLSFGAEAASLYEQELIKRAAFTLHEEPLSFQKDLQLQLKNGCSYPTARTRALLNLPLFSEADQTEAHTLLSSPNNILAIEYLKALYRLQSDITPCIITREGSGYHEETLGSSFSSASSIRKKLCEELREDQILPEMPPELRTSVPEYVCQILSDAKSSQAFLAEDDFSDLLFYALSAQADQLVDCGPGNRDLAQRTYRLLDQFQTWSQFAALLKTKNQTYTAISRYLTHILLGLTREHMDLAAEVNNAPYARILGFRKSAAPLLKSLQEKAAIPLITSPAKAQRSLTPKQNALLCDDLRASSIYNRMLFSRSGISRLSDYRQPLICI